MNDDNGVFHYTVAQLIEELKKLPQDLPVVTSGYESGYENFYQPAVVNLRHEPENLYSDGEFQTADGDESNAFRAVIFQRVFRDD